MSALREILAHFSIEADDKELHEAAEGVDGLIEKLKHLGEAVAVAFMAKELFEFASGMAEAAIEVEHSAQAFGLSTTEMQQWQLAAKASGVSTESLDTGFKMLAKNVGAGAGPGVDALRKLGVTVKDASGQVRPMGDLFEDAGAAIGTMENAGERAAAGQAVFGRQFIKLIPLLSKGKEGMAELRAKLEELGGGFDENFIEKSKEVEEQSAFLGQAWTSLKVTLAAYLLPALTWLTTKGVTLVKTMIDLAKNTEIVKTAAIALGIAGIGALSALIGPLGAAFGTLLTTVLPLVAAFLLVEDFLTFLSGGESEFGDLINAIFGDGAAEKVRAWFKSVGDDLANVGADFADLWLGAKLVWNVLTDAIALGIAGFIDGFDALWIAIKLGGRYAAATFSDAFSMAWNDIIEGAKKALGVISALPGLSKVADSLNGLKTSDPHALKDLAAEPTEQPQAVKNVLAMMDREKQGYVQQSDASHNVQTNSDIFGPPAPVTVHVTVPPGTPETLAKRVGDASAEGAHRGAQTARSTHAALNPGKG